MLVDILKIFIDLVSSRHWGNIKPHYKVLCLKHNTSFPICAFSSIYICATPLTLTATAQITHDNFKKGLQIIEELFLIANIV